MGDEGVEPRVVRLLSGRGVELVVDRLLGGRRGEVVEERFWWRGSGGEVVLERLLEQEVEVWGGGFFSISVGWTNLILRFFEFPTICFLVLVLVFGFWYYLFHIHSYQSLLFSAPSGILFH